MGVTGAIIAATAIAAAGTGFQISEAQASRRQARRLSREQTTRQQELQKQFQTQKSQSESEAAERKARAAARRRQRALQTAGTSRADQLLTGPSGVTAEPTGTRKTLLGA